MKGKGERERERKVHLRDNFIDRSKCGNVKSKMATECVCVRF